MDNRTTSGFGTLRRRSGKAPERSRVVDRDSVGQHHPLRLKAGGRGKRLSQPHRGPRRRTCAPRARSLPWPHRFGVQRRHPNGDHRCIGAERAGPTVSGRLSGRGVHALAPAGVLVVGLQLSALLKRRLTRSAATAVGRYTAARLALGPVVAELVTRVGWPAPLVRAPIGTWPVSVTKTKKLHLWVAVD